MMDLFTIQRGQGPFVFSVLFTVLLTQLYLWLFGRHDIDSEWWKAAVFGLIASVLLQFVAYSAYHAGLFGICLSLTGTSIPLWISAGFFYEIEGWRRFLLSGLCIECVLVAIVIKSFQMLLS